MGCNGVTSLSASRSDAFLPGAPGPDVALSAGVLWSNRAFHLDGTVRTSARMRSDLDLKLTNPESVKPPT